MDEFDILQPQLSRVAKSTDNLIITIHGLGGLGKTPVAAKMEKPLYLAFGKSGLEGMNNVPFFSIKDWATFKKIVRSLCDAKNKEALKERYQTIILDELEVLWGYCETYVSLTNGVNKIKEGNSGYGLWADLKTEWEGEFLKIFGSGFCIFNILHTAPDDNGRMFPVGDVKRMLPIILNHSSVIGYVSGNGVDPDTLRPIHSSLMLAGTPDYFARTRNEYFDTYLEDFTAQNLVQAYYDAIDRQAKAENVDPVTVSEREQLFSTKEVDFDALFDEVADYGSKLIAAQGKEKLVEITEKVLGKGKKVSDITPKQSEALQIILMDIKDALQ